MKKLYNIFQIVFTIFSSTLIICSCTVQKRGDNVIIRDDLFYKLCTAKDYPNSRRFYIPSARDLESVINCERIERNYFYLKVDFNKSNILKQKTFTNCWATCTVMLLKHESDIRNINNLPELENLYFSILKEANAANDVKIYRKLLDKFKVVTYTKPITQSMVTDSLLRNHPLIVGFRPTSKSDLGHVCLLTGIYFSFTDSLIRSIAIDCIEVIDPNPFNGGIKKYNGSYLKENGDFAISFIDNLITNGLTTGTIKSDEYSWLLQLFQEE